MHDPVNQPQHYCQGGIECIDAIESSMSQEAFRGFLKANCIKYLWRYEHKNGCEDLRKAQWYLSRLIEDLETEEGMECLSAITEDACKKTIQKQRANYSLHVPLADSGCSDGFCPIPSVRQGPSEPMFEPVCDY